MSFGTFRDVSGRFGNFDKNSTGQCSTRNKVKTRAHGYILTKLPDPQPEWPSDARPGSANPGSVFEPRAPIQGASCASRIVCLSRFKPRPGWRTKGLIWALLFVVVARLISGHLTMEQPSQITICDGYSFTTVTNEGSMESPQRVPSICMVGR